MRPRRFRCRPHWTRRAAHDRARGSAPSDCFADPGHCGGRLRTRRGRQSPGAQGGRGARGRGALGAERTPGPEAASRSRRFRLSRQHDPGRDADALRRGIGGSKISTRPIAAVHRAMPSSNVAAPPSWRRSPQRARAMSNRTAGGSNFAGRRRGGCRAFSVHSASIRASRAAITAALISPCPQARPFSRPPTGSSCSRLMRPSRWRAIC